jgi:hypothetical protein
MLVVLGWVIGGFVAYWLPTIIAFARNHPEFGPIFAVNLLIGWTGVGWVVALLMAVIWWTRDGRGRVAALRHP